MNMRWTLALVIVLLACSPDPLPPQPPYGGPCARAHEFFECLDDSNCVAHSEGLDEIWTVSICRPACTQANPRGPYPDRFLEHDCPAPPAGFTGAVWCEEGRCNLHCASDADCGGEMVCDDDDCAWPNPDVPPVGTGQDLSAVQTHPNGGIAAGLLRAATGWRLCGSGEDCTDATPDCEPTVDDCLRDTYACAAITLAWAAASHAAIGDDASADAELDAMMTNLCNVDNLCSSAPPVGGGVCFTEAMYPCPGLSCPGG
jgi:hypothetical protein